MNRIYSLLLILLLVICSFHIKNITIENFTTDSLEWGYDPVKSYTKWDTDLTRQIVGPDPSKNEVNHWQYNPDNTQVDYKYYQNSHDVQYLSERHNLGTDDTQNNLIQQLAPITWASVGKNTSPMDFDVPVPSDIQQTRSPDGQSDESKYVIPAPSSEPQYTGPETTYQW